MTFIIWLFSNLFFFNWLDEKNDEYKIDRYIKYYNKRR